MEYFLYQLAAKIDASVVNIPKTDANSTINAGLTTVYYVAGIVAVIAIIIGGLLYTTANGDPEKVKQAKNTILYSVIGLIVVIFAFAITAFVIGKVK